MFQELLEALAQELEARNITYMLIGGQAVLLYGVPRLTEDVDVTLDAGPEALAEVLQAVERLGWEVLVKDAAAFVKKTLVLPCQDPGTGIRIDLIFSFSPYEHQAMGRARTVQVGKAKVRYAALEDVVIHKVIAGRPRDLEDVRVMLMKNPGVDLDYLRSWLGEFEQALGQPLVARFETLWKEAG